MDLPNPIITKRKLFITPTSFDRGRDKLLKASTSNRHISAEECNQMDITLQSINANLVPTESLSTERSSRLRGKNKCNLLGKLKTGKKLSVTFYNGRAVSSNHETFIRNLGLIVRDRNICPIKVIAWKDIDTNSLNHMWEAVKEKFENDQIELYRESTLDHMQSLWKNWRGKLKRKYVTTCTTRQEALLNIPKGFDKNDWEWLIKNYYMSERFMKMSETNSHNRSNATMPHRTGSKPFRQIAYEMGGKYGNPPDIKSLFFETRKKGDTIVDEDALKKYDEICEVMRLEPQLSSFQVVEKCFGTQKHSHVFGYGGGVKVKDVRGPLLTKQQINMNNNLLQSKVENLEAEVKAIKELLKNNMIQANVQLSASSSETVQKKSRGWFANKY